MRIATLLFLVVASLVPVRAEHLPGGSITTRCISGIQHQVTLQLWRECTGAPMIGQSLNFRNSCGVEFTLSNLPLISVENVSPVCPDQLDQTTCNGGPFIGIELYTYRTTLSLSACNFWTISWNTCCRYPSVNLNGAPGIYLEAKLNNAGNACLESPVFSDPVPPFVCLGQPVSYDLGVTAQPGQQLRYRFIEARRQTGVNPIVVEPVTYQAPYSGAEPFTGMAIDSLTGNISFTPILQGYIIVSVEVSFRDGNGVLRGTVMRDFPFVAQSCANNVPDAASGALENAQGAGTITGSYSIATCGGSLCFDATVTDADAGQTLTLTSNINQVVLGASFEVNGSSPATATICLDASGLPLGTYAFIITAADNACPVVGSQTFTYTLTVESASATAGDDATASICPGQSIDLSTLLTGDPGGVWSAGPLVNAPGAYTYTIATSCGSDEAVFTITANQAPNAGNGAVATICQGDEVDLSTLITGDPGGSWSEGPIVSSGGTYTYTVTNACGSDEAAFVVNEVITASAGEDNAIAVCQLSPQFLLVDSLLGAPASGGAWTGPSGPVGPAFSPGTSAEGTYCYTVLNPLPCPASTACLSVSYLPDEDPACITLGLPETNAAVVLAPNPSTGRLILSGARATHAEVVDAMGRALWQSGRSAELATIELPGALPNGSYAIRLRMSDGRWLTHRFELLR